MIQKSSLCVDGLFIKNKIDQIIHKKNKIKNKNSPNNSNKKQQHKHKNRIKGVCKAHGIDVAWKCEHVIVKRYLYYKDTTSPTNNN